MISQSKLVKYILSQTHPVGRFKAKFFRQSGFDETNANLFEEALKAIAESQDVQKVIKSPYGTKYLIQGKIETPIGKTVAVKTVWIIEKGETNPRFVTVYPV